VTASSVWSGVHSLIGSVGMIVTSTHADCNSLDPSCDTWAPVSTFPNLFS
jgi:hypothetical protein